MVKKRIALALVLLMSGSLLASCGKKVENGPTAAGESLLEDTHETNLSKISGRQTETEAGDLVIEATEAEEETSSILQEEPGDDMISSESNADTQVSEGIPEESETSAMTQAPETVDVPAETAAEEVTEKITENVTEKSTETLTEKAIEEAAEKTTESEITAPDPFAKTGVLSQIQGREASGEKWALAYESLDDGTKAGWHEDVKMQSASVVKLFIMGAVYQYMCYPESDEEMINFGESYEGELRDTIEKMITVSDNNAANTLVERLGKGDFAEGEKVIGKFCEKYGYSETSVGRRFMASSLADGDNYTSASDVRKFYSDLYHGRLVNEEASGKMLDIVKGQTLKNKIPAGLPEGFTSGNKTGEMPDGYGLGCIENDSAIIFPPESNPEGSQDGNSQGYILVVLSNDLAGRNSEAQGVITQISSQVAGWYLKM